MPEQTPRTLEPASGRHLLAILAGLLMTLLDVRHRGLDLVLPDFFGYWLIALGLWRLRPLDRRFRAAHVAAVVMIFLSLGTLVERKVFLAELGLVDYYYNPLWPAEVAAIVGDVVMVWFLGGGLRQLAFRRGRASLAQSAGSVRHFYLTVGVLKLACLGFYLRAPPLQYYFVIPLVGFHILSGLLVLDLLWTAWSRRNELLPQATQDSTA